MYTFIKYNGLLKESKLYSTKVDYETIFDNLEENVVDNLSKLTDYYYEYIKTQLDTLKTITIPIYLDKKIDNIPVKLYIYINTDYKEFINNSQPTVKIGVNVSLPSKEYISSDYFDVVQNIHILHCDIDNVEIFKNYVYNTLFYGYIILNEFSFNPMLKFLNHDEDIEDLVEISTAHIKLFGDENECCVCNEETITKTKCNHGICQQCYSSLDKKICPMCRKNLTTDDDYTGEIFFYVG